MNDFYYDIEEPAISEESNEHAPRNTISDDDILYISNPVEARLPSAQISVKLLKRILETRASAARAMPTTLRPNINWNLFTTSTPKAGEVTTSRDIATSSGHVITSNGSGTSSSDNITSNKYITTVGDNNIPEGHDTTPSDNVSPSNEDSTTISDINIPHGDSTPSNEDVTTPEPIATVTD